MNIKNLLSLFFKKFVALTVIAVMIFPMIPREIAFASTECDYGPDSGVSKSTCSAEVVCPSGYTETDNPSGNGNGTIECVANSSAVYPYQEVDSHKGILHIDINQPVAFGTLNSARVESGSNTTQAETNTGKSLRGKSYIVYGQDPDPSIIINTSITSETVNRAYINISWQCARKNVRSDVYRNGILIYSDEYYKNNSFTDTVSKQSSAQTYTYGVECFDHKQDESYQCSNQEMAAEKNPNCQVFVDCNEYIINPSGSFDTTSTGNKNRDYCIKRNNIKNITINSCPGGCPDNYITASIADSAPNPNIVNLAWVCPSNTTNYNITRNDGPTVISSTGRSGSTEDDIAKKSSTQTYIYTLNCKKYTASGEGKVIIYNGESVADEDIPQPEGGKRWGGDSVGRYCGQNYRNVNTGAMIGRVWVNADNNYIVGEYCYSPELEMCYNRTLGKYVRIEETVTDVYAECGTERPTPADFEVVFTATASVTVGPATPTCVAPQVYDPATNSCTNPTTSLCPDKTTTVPYGQENTCPRCPTGTDQAGSFKTISGCYATCPAPNGTRQDNASDCQVCPAGTDQAGQPAPANNPAYPNCYYTCPAPNSAQVARSSDCRVCPVGTYNAGDPAPGNDIANCTATTICPVGTDQAGTAAPGNNLSNCTYTCDSGTKTNYPTQCTVCPTGTDQAGQNAPGNNAANCYKTCPNGVRVSDETKCAICPDTAKLPGSSAPGNDPNNCTKVCWDNSEVSMITPCPAMTNVGVAGRQDSVTPIGGNMTVRWTTEGNTCTVGNYNNTIIYTTQVYATKSAGTLRSVTYNFSNPLHTGYLSTSHLNNNNPSNPIGYTVKCRDTTNPTRPEGTSIAVGQVYDPVNATIGVVADTTGGITFTCGRDYDYYSLRRDGVELVGPLTYGGENQTVSRAHTVTTAPNGTYVLNCRSVGIAANTQTVTRVYAAPTVTGSISGNTGGTAVNAESNEGKFTSLTYQVQNAGTFPNSIRVRQEIRKYDGTTQILDTNNFTPSTRPLAKYIPSASNGYTVSLAIADSPTIEEGMTWTIYVTQGAYTRTLVLNIENASNVEMIDNDVVPDPSGGTDDVIITITCRNATRWEIYNDSVSTTVPLTDANTGLPAAGDTGTSGVFTKSVKYRLTSSSPTAKKATIRSVCIGVSDDKENPIVTDIPSRRNPKLTKFRTYPENVICSPGTDDARKISLEYAIENANNCSIDAFSVRSTDYTATDSAAAKAEKDRIKAAIAKTNEELDANVDIKTSTDPDNVKTETGVVRNVTIKYATKFRVTCDGTMETAPGVTLEKAVASVCQGEN